MTDKIAEIRARHSKRSETDLHGCYRLDGFTYQMTMKQSQLDLAIALAEVERLRAEKEALYASIAGIERAAAGAIYSQESIHAMALYALKPLMERGIEALEAKP